MATILKGFRNLLTTGRWQKPIGKASVDPAYGIQGGFWRLTDPSDDTGLSQHYSVTGSVTDSVGPFGPAKTFPGTANNYIRIPNSPANSISSQPLTLWAWVTMTALDGDIFSKGNNSPNVGFNLGVGTAAIGFGAIGGTNGVASCSNASLTTNALHMVAVTWDGNLPLTGVNIYIDGVAQTMTNGGGATQNAADTFDLIIGGSENTSGTIRVSGNTGNLLNGSVNHGGVDRRVYSAGEIQRLFLDPFGMLNSPEGEMPALFMAAAGNTYNDSVTEAASASDAASASAVFVSSTTETGSASDVSSAVAVFAASDTETSSASDTASVTAVFAASDTEGVSASDTSSTGFSDSTTETATATDIENATAVFAASISESGTATDTPTVVAVFAATASEAGTATDIDSATATFAATISESATASDSVDATFGNQTYPVSQSEAVSAIDRVDATVVSSSTQQYGGRRHTDWEGRRTKRERLADDQRERERAEKKVAFHKTVVDTVRPPVVEPKPEPAREPAAIAKKAPVVQTDTPELKIARLQETAAKARVVAAEITAKANLAETKHKAAIKAEADTKVAVRLKAEAEKREQIRLQRIADDNRAIELLLLSA